MSEGVAEMARTDSWSGLLEETRQALSKLRAEDLEELAARAQAMFAANIERESSGQVRSTPTSEELVEVDREHRLLGDLLLATEKNLAVMRRLQGRLSDRTYDGEVNRRWVR
jgi:hypothetical protein